MKNYQESEEEKPRLESWKHQPINITLNQTKIINDIKSLIAERR